MEKPTIVQKSPYVKEEKAGKYAWCACGKSANQPYCDGKHKGSSFSPIVEVLNEDKKIKIVDSLKKIAFLMNKYEKDYQVSQKIIMEKNIEKLYSRKERGTLKGSGDNR